MATLRTLVLPSHQHVLPGEPAMPAPARKESRAARCGVYKTDLPPEETQHIREVADAYKRLVDLRDHGQIVTTQGFSYLVLPKKEDRPT